MIVTVRIMAIKIMTMIKNEAINDMAQFKDKSNDNDMELRQ